MLDLWLLAVLRAWLIETLLLSTTIYRFSLVWYAGRIYGVLAASFVPMALLAQTTTLYARLAASSMARHRERENRLMAMDAVLALVAHDTNPPLSAIVLNGSTGLRELARDVLDAGELGAKLNDIISDRHRASQVIGDIRAMFRSDDAEKVKLDINDLVGDALAHLHGELHSHEITVETDIGAKLPRVPGNRVQLQQVLSNLIINAIESIDLVPERSRALRVRTERDGSAVRVEIEDSGPGFDPRVTDQIFDPFFTTKDKGTGLGLPISRSIIADHAGRLWALPATPHGAIFQFTVAAGDGGRD